MDILKKGRELLEEDTRVALLDGEQMQKTGLGTVAKGIKTGNVNVTVTNQRLMYDTNLKTMGAIAAGATAAGGAAGNLATGAASGAAAASTAYTPRFTTPLSNIVDVQPGRYKLFGFIPTRDTAINFKFADGKTLTILFEQRDEWLAAIKNALAGSKPA
jgi:hypothetical protein